MAIQKMMGPLQQNGGELQDFRKPPRLLPTYDAFQRSLSALAPAAKRLELRLSPVFSPALLP